MSNPKAYFMCSEGQAVCSLGPARISLLALNTCKSVNPRSVLPPFTLLHVESDPRGPGGSYPPAASDWLLATCRHVDLFRSADLSRCLQRRRKTQPSCCWLSWPIQPWMNIFISKLFTFRKKKSYLTGSTGTERVDGLVRSQQFSGDDELELIVQQSFYWFGFRLVTSPF